MRFFEHKLSIILLYISIPLLFLPKINLISLAANESAGLRIDDLVLFLIGILLMWAHTLSHKRLHKIEGWLLLLTVFSFVSFLSNRFLVSFGLLYMDAKIFYTIRMMEYFIFFYLGALSFQYLNVDKIIRAFFLWNILIMVLQKVNILGAVTVDGYSGNASARVFGIASFPSEMGLILNLLFCYLVWNETTSHQILQVIPKPLRSVMRSFYLYWMFAIFGTLIIFTGNRISIVALFICFFCRFFQKLNLRSLGSLITLLVFVPLLLVGIGFLITISEGVYQRSLDLFTFKNLELFEVVWDHVDITKDPFEKMSSSDNYDMSWLLRLHKWIFAIKSYLHTSLAYLQGVGPGFSQAALDGGLLRILIEYGIIGTFLHWKFFACLYRLNTQTKWMMISFIINMIFFDAYLAYKTMSLLFFACGYIFERKHYAATLQSSNVDIKLNPIATQ